MNPTPFFSAWRNRLAPMGSRVAQTLQTVRPLTLGQLEDRFAASLPQNLFPKAASHHNSRDRIYTRLRTFWCMIWQALNPQAAGREVVRQIQALFQLHDGPNVSQEDGAYCRARQRLPQEQFAQALAATAQAADAATPSLSLLQGRPLKAADGSILTLPDTAKKS